MHVATCGHVRVPCPFPGCETTVSRKDIDAHLQSAAAAHLALAVAQKKDLDNKARLIASSDVKVEIRELPSGARDTVFFKRFEPILHQEGYRSDVVCFTVRELGRGLDASKTPHELGIRDGMTLEVVTSLSASFNIKTIETDGREIYFKVKMGTRFERLFNAYADRRNGINPSRMSCTYNGERVRADQTPADLGMEDQAEVRFVYSSVRAR